MYFYFDAFRLADESSSYRAVTEFDADTLVQIHDEDPRDVLAGNLFQLYGSVYGKLSAFSLTGEGTVEDLSAYQIQPVMATQVSILPAEATGGLENHKKIARFVAKKNESVSVSTLIDGQLAVIVGWPGHDAGYNGWIVTVHHRQLRRIGGRGTWSNYTDLPWNCRVVPLELLMGSDTDADSSWRNRPSLLGSSYIR